MNKIEALTSMLGEYATPELIDYLKQKNFFVCPASVKHHGNETGGLVTHSIAVANVLQTLTKNNKLKWKREISPILVGLLHDICKTDDYICVIDNPGKELFGGITVDEEEHWEYNPEPVMKGHGDKSVMMLSSVIQLTEEEMFCIRFHMGAFTDSSEWKFYTNAVHKYENVLWTHQADMIAAHLMGL